MSHVVCRLPKAGLGNQLFPLMHAAVFSHINNLPLTVIGYHQIKIGPYIRKEKTKRNYNGFFKFEKNLIAAFFDELKVKKWLRQYEVVFEHDLHKLSAENSINKVFLFEKIPSYKDYFYHLRPHRPLVLHLLMNMISEKQLKKVATLEIPEIGVHIRMGDFKKLASGEIFKGGHVRTPESYFIKIIKGINEISGKELSVSVFTDGYKEEFDELLISENINIAEGNTDVVDMLLLSKSRLIVISTSSTFSYWSGFLSEAPIIMHPEHIHARIREKNKEDSLFEGGFDNAIPFLIKYLKK
jgi:hypothetical protein